MKRFLLVLIIVFISKNIGFSQNSIDPFKLDGIEWFETEGVANGSTSAGTDFYCNFYKICGDTIHSGNTYKKVFKGTKLYFLGTNGCPPFNCIKPTAPSSFSFYCFFRQDTLTKSNYYKMPGMINDSLLVSYNLNVGDTIKRGFYASTYRSFCGEVPVVYLTDSITVEGKKVKVYYIKNGWGVCSVSSANHYCNLVPNYSFLIEGLGSINGFLYRFGPKAEYSWNEVDSISFNYNCSNNTISVKSNNEIRNLSISPNPNNGIFTLETNSSTPQTVQLVDVTGRLVLTQIVTGKSQIDASKLPEGIYNLSVAGRDFVINRRIIISK